MGYCRMKNFKFWGSVIGILGNIGPIAEVHKVIRPIYNFMAGE